MAFRFGPYRLDPDTGELTRNGEPIELQPLGHELLELLLHNPGTLFRREELQSALWPDVTVGDDSLTMLVSRTRKALGDRKVIETVPRRGYRLAIDVVEEADPVVPPGPDSGPRPARPPAPPPDLFVGRAHTLLAIDHRLETARWLTLTGPGGAGKTRLALEWLARHPSSGLFVDGSDAHDPEALARAVAAVLDLPSSTADIGLALAALGPLTLVLDNLEQVADAGPQLVDWLRAAPQLRLLATSRVVLGARGETVLPVEPLPPAHARTLFLAREPRLETDPDLDPLIAALDGLPLALELLAPRSRLLSAARLQRLLDDRLAVLREQDSDRPARQQSLQAVLDGSWALLPEAGRQALIALACFRAPFTLGDVEALVPDGLEVLQGLVDHSLVHPRPVDRFALLLTVRDYVREQASTAQRSRSQRAWAHHLARLGADHARDAMLADATGSESRAAEAALPDLRAATRFAIEQEDASLAGPLALATWQVMRRTGPFDQASALMDQVFDLGSPSITLMHATAQSALLAGRQARAVSVSETLLSRAKAENRPQAQVIARVQLAHHFCDQDGGLPAAEAHTRAALEIARATGNLYYESVAHALLSGIARHRKQFDRSAEHSETAARLYAQLPDVGLEGLRLATLGLAHRDRGEPNRATERFREAHAVYAADGDRFRVVEILDILADHLSDQGHTADALVAAKEAVVEARLLGNPTTLAQMLLLAGRLARRQGQEQEGMAQLEEARQLARRSGLSALADGVSEALREPAGG